MSNQGTFSKQLLEQNGGRATGTGPAGEIRRLVEKENARVRRLHRISMIAWGVSLLLPAGWLGIYYSQRLVGRTGADVDFWTSVYMASPLVLTLGAVALVVALITSVGWFFGSRTLTLAAIDQRLMRLERLLEQEEGGER